jgi:hypothetical protein
MTRFPGVVDLRILIFIYLCFSLILLTLCMLSKTTHSLQVVVVLYFAYDA